MRSPDPSAVDNQILVQYLLGSLPEDNAEHLDELSVSNDEFAMRLSAIENDLVDAYVRGELSGQTLEKFQAFYLSTVKRREKVRFAESLFAFEKKSAIDGCGAPVAPAQEERREVRSSWRSFLIIPRWGFAAAATMLAVAGFLALDNVRLYNEMSRAQADRAVLQQREHDLQARLDEQHAANAESVKELAQVRESLALLEKQAVGNQQPSGVRSSPIIASLVLSPQTRGAAQMATLSLSPGTTRVDLRLELESDDFPQYRVALKDSATSQILWRSGKLKSDTKGQSSAVSISVPENLLKQQNYELELSGIPSSGATEFLSSYVFKVVSD
jgi:hypothetical protein